MRIGRGLTRPRDRRRWPVRWWLAILNAAIAGGTVLVLGGLLLVLRAGGLQEQLAASLRSQAEPVVERELGAPPPPPSPRKPFGKPVGKPEPPDAPPDVPPDPATADRLRSLS